MLRQPVSSARPSTQAHSLAGWVPAKDTPDVRYIAHPLVAVWSPTGYLVAFTALNLAALAADRGFDTALVNYDLRCPDLDAWFSIKQTGVDNFDDAGTGVMTFDGEIKPEIVAQFLKKSAWGIQYLPAGNKFGNPVTPEIEDDDLEQILKLVWRRDVGNKPAITIFDVGARYEDATALAAFRQASVVIVPTDGTPPMAAVIRQQVDDLTRMGRAVRLSPQRWQFTFYILTARSLSMRNTMSALPWMSKQGLPSTGPASVPG